MWDAPQKTKPQSRVARISTLEIAIRAQSKRFLAHPLVVQQLEGIWAGKIVFHSSADNLHRPPQRTKHGQTEGYGTIDPSRSVPEITRDHLPSQLQRTYIEPATFSIRRSVTLYDPRDASLFKLSRLRVPRYRQILSTCSFAILLGLYLAVLIQRSLDITPLEIVFWIWSAGFMLDEIVGFNEQGFSLYIMSFWNTFDVGILLLLVCFYCMRLYGILMRDSYKQAVADTAYDMLASNAVLLFPRLFSVLDHYRYFSQLLIAFRMMAMDLVAVFILIVISCSGFFVAFTLSFGGDHWDAGGVAYALFQMLMGYTPAAWDYWEKYNMLGRSILTLFLFICHFLIVTILITVLTNSFMAVVQNANEEHQFVFAVNAISMVKSDALFSYIAPTNVIAWILTPLRFLIPFRQFVRLNRTVIKATHFPILYIIYVYESIILQKSSFEPADLVEQRGRPGTEGPFFEARSGNLSLFSPRQHRLREHSVATLRKDRALDEVFRRPFRDTTIRNIEKSNERRKTSNVVNSWMQNMGPDGTASPPVEQDRAIVDRLEARRLAHRQSHLQLPRLRKESMRNFTEATMSVMSDPEEFGSIWASHRRKKYDRPARDLNRLAEQTDADGDDEHVTNDEDEILTLDRQPIQSPPTRPKEERTTQEGYFELISSAPITSPTIKSPTLRFSLPLLPNRSKDESSPDSPSTMKKQTKSPSHDRRASNVSAIYDPPTQQPEDLPTSTGFDPRKEKVARNQANDPVASGNLPLLITSTSPVLGKRSPKRGLARTRPIMPPHGSAYPAPNPATGLFILDNNNNLGGGGDSTTFAMELGSDIGDNKAVGGGFVGAVPSNFATQMAFVTGAVRAGQAAAASGNEDQRMMGKLMLARMNALEEGFREVVKEVKEWRKKAEEDGTRPSSMGDNDGGGKNPTTVFGSNSTGDGIRSRSKLRSRKPCSSGMRVKDGKISSSNKIISSLPVASVNAVVSATAAAATTGPGTETGTGTGTGTGNEWVDQEGGEEGRSKQS